jgi:UDP-glucose 4-epimerase
VADPSAAMKVLGFAPNWTDIDVIVESAWNWHRAKS